MEGYASVNDLNEVIAADKKHVWHHLIQHKMFETVDPRVIVEGKGMRVWDVTRLYFTLSVATPVFCWMRSTILLASSTE
mgnify:CR=1 FL=1